MGFDSIEINLVFFKNAHNCYAFMCNFKDVLRKFKGYLKEVSNVFQENLIKSFKGVSRIFQ